MTEVPETLSAAVGRILSAEDVVTAAPVAGLMATFGRSGAPPQPGDPLPPLWHGLYCTAKLPPERLGADGLARDEGLLPAAPGYPDKLFGGAQFRFLQPIRIGDALRKESEIVSVTAKDGRSGAFLVAVVEHRLAIGAGVAVVERNDIIFRPPKDSRPPPQDRSSSPPPASSPADWTQTVTPDPVLMFRHSALTFNSHRIHYDRDYARAHGFPGLLVQGMLIARLMLEMLRRDAGISEISSFSFRSGRPIYDDGPFTLSGVRAGDGISLLARDHAGRTGITAEARIA